MPRGLASCLNSDERVPELSLATYVQPGVHFRVPVPLCLCGEQCATGYRITTKKNHQTPLSRAKRV
jgi:hypothetical protein